MRDRFALIVANVARCFYKYEFIGSVIKLVLKDAMKQIFMLSDDVSDREY